MSHAYQKRGKVFEGLRKTASPTEMEIHRYTGLDLGFDDDGVLVTLFEVLLDKGETVFTVRTVLIRVAVWLVGGLVYGMWTRSFLLKKYRNVKARQTPT